MRNPVRRKENREVKYNLDRVKATLEAKRANMSAPYEADMAGLCTAETKVLETLNTAGVSAINYVPYLLV